MYDKFTMELVWHNCKTYPPKEDYNDCLFITQGYRSGFGNNYISSAKYHHEYGWIDRANRIRISDKDLHRYWWADINQTIQGESRFEELK